MTDISELQNRVEAHEKKVQEKEENKRAVKTYMEAHPDMLIRHVRRTMRAVPNTRGIIYDRPIVGTVVAIGSGQVGWSKVMKGDKFNRHAGILEAIKKIGVPPCFSMEQYVIDMLKRADYHFSEKIIVDVTWEDIAASQRDNLYNPIALAINRLLPSNLSVTTDPTGKYVISRDNRFYRGSYTLPKKAYSALLAHKAGFALTPFSFKIRKDSLPTS